MASTSSTNSLLVPAQIDFYQRKIDAPIYKMLRVPLNNISGAAVNIGATSSQQLEFKLPANKVYNLSRSYLSYSQSLVGVALECNWMFQDAFTMGNTVTFGSAGGNDLVNLQYANNYTKIARKLFTPMVDLMTNSALCGLNSYRSTDATNYVPGGNISQRDVDTPEVPVYIGCDDYHEVQYVSHSAALGDAQTNFYQYPLDAFKGTLLAVDRDFYAPVEQYLRITCGPGNKMAFVSDSITDPSDEVAAPAAEIKLKNIYLYLCVEQNPIIIASMMDSFQRGQLKYTIPYVSGFKTVGSSTANQQTNISLTLTRQYGKRLKRVIHSVFNPTESLNTAYDQDNCDGAKIRSYQTFLDNTPLQDRILSCEISNEDNGVVGFDDYAENRKFLGKSAAIFGAQQYQLNWFHMDQFFEPHDVTRGASLPEVNIDEGILMDSDKQWLFSGASVGASLVHYTWAEFTREILITPDGAHFV